MASARYILVTALLMTSYFSVVEASGKCQAWVSVLYRPYPTAPWTWIQVSDHDDLLLEAGVEYAVELNTECFALLYRIIKDGVVLDSASTQAFLPPCCTGLIYPITEPGAYRFNAWAQESASLEVDFVSNTELSSVSFRCFGVLLSGNMSEEYSFARMRTNLSDMHLIPSNEPFTQLGWVDETSGGETMSDVVQMEGYADLVDWVRFEFHEAQEPHDLRYAANLLLTRSGHLVTPSGDYILRLDVPPGQYTIKLRHRNHLALTYGPYFFPGPEFYCDLDGADIPTIGEDTRETIGWNKWALRAGNALIDHNEQRISYTGTNNDRDAILNRIGGADPIATVTGYFNEDVNMDGVVKYTGANNDRDVILQAIGGVDPTNVVEE